MNKDTDYIEIFDTKLTKKGFEELALDIADIIWSFKAVLDTLELNNKNPFVEIVD